MTKLFSILNKKCVNFAPLFQIFNLKWDSLGLKWHIFNLKLNISKLKLNIFPQKFQILESGPKWTVHPGESGRPGEGMKVDGP